LLDFTEEVTDYAFNFKFQYTMIFYLPSSKRSIAANPENVRKVPVVE